MNIKVALLGNMNNNFFALCRYLRDAGYDAHLILLNEFGHFYPSCDTFDDEYKQYVIETDWHQHYFFDPLLPPKIKSTLKNFDVLIGCDLAPAYTSMIGRKLDIFIPYGGDLVLYTKIQTTLPPLKVLYRLLTLKRPFNPEKKKVAYQVKGIKNAGCIIAENAYHTDAVINDLFSSVKRYNFTLPMVYDIFKNSAPGQIADIVGNENVKHFLDSTKGKKIFFSHTRHCWIPENSRFLKGNDEIIKAFAEYCKIHTDTVLVLFEYGVDVDASRALISQLGISSHVLWMPLMDRKYILYMLNHADLCIGEITDSFLTYGVVLEAIVMKTPLAHNYKLASAESGYDYMYDCFHVANKDDIKEVMIKVHDGAFDKQKMVSASYEWYQNQIVNKFLSVFRGMSEKV